MSLLARYRAELTEERAGRSAAFARALRFGDKVFYVFCGLAIGAIFLGFWEAERIPASSIDGSGLKAWAIFFGFLGAGALVFCGAFIKVFVNMIFSDRGSKHG
ncbi:hypothetical protein QWY75_03700 [Pontixanthobacter aestiaquae]|uniref:Uncharacterized protein n=1 Tax=Pontixanthobacter aestiaquae TaxID=1509367 RepID=A0A844Z9H2_9SPHN|nr:hypothetical protein [Pontixanthobacter aestiaquae]MDN3645311.1 hypothetical protein [Pontixanthobacter aestiaquae]MXO83687.1 hypothetical protein [Pontixanthobacter aestiaquae]